MAKTILVVEDEKTLSFAIEESLERNNFKVIKTNTEEGAIQLLNKEKKIDAVWLDHYLLGKKTGLDFMHFLRQNEKWQNLPVFVVTNSVADDKIASYNIMGIEKYFVKSDSTLNDIIGSIKATIS